MTRHFPADARRDQVRRALLELGRGETLTIAAAEPGLPDWTVENLGADGLKLTSGLPEDRPTLAATTEEALDQLAL